MLRTLMIASLGLIAALAVSSASAFANSDAPGKVVVDLKSDNGFLTIQQTTTGASASQGAGLTSLVVTAEQGSCKVEQRVTISDRGSQNASFALCGLGRLTIQSGSGHYMLTLTK